MLCITGVMILSLKMYFYFYCLAFYCIRNIILLYICISCNVLWVYLPLYLYSLPSSVSLLLKMLPGKIAARTWVSVRSLGLTVALSFQSDSSWLLLQVYTSLVSPWQCWLTRTPTIVIWAIPVLISHPHDLSAPFPFYLKTSSYLFTDFASHYCRLFHVL